MRGFNFGIAQHDKHVFRVYLQHGSGAERLVMQLGQFNRRKVAELAVAMFKAELCAIFEGEETMQRVVALADFYEGYVPEVHRRHLAR